MEDKIRRYIDDLFAETAPTKKAVELKEEMIQNLSDKFSDLTAEGKTPEAAYNITIAGIGDISTLLAELEKDMTNKEPTIHEMEASRQKSALLTAASVRAGKLNASSVSGAVNLSEAYVTAIDVSTTSGRTIAEGEFERVDVSTISGNTTIRSRVAPATIDISSVSGAMDIYIPNTGEITVNHSAVSGRFSSDVPVIMQNRAAAYSFSSVSGNTNIHLFE